jgi:hypothetical protein
VDMVTSLAACSTAGNNSDKTMGWGFMI